MAHPNITHCDDVEPLVYEAGDMAGRRWRLGSAGGARDVGLSRLALAPGGRSTPVHTHADEEEIVYVLGGSGLSWQDGRTYAIAEGDCIVHREQAEAHTLLASDHGLDVLVFGAGSRTNITWLPRAGRFWLGSHWVPAVGEHPYVAEVAAGPIDRPAPEAERPAHIVHSDAVESETLARGEYACQERDLAAAAGSVRSGLRHDVLPAGKLGCPPHWHTAEEEVFVVLDGAGEALLDEQPHPLRAGSVLVRPPGSRVSHALRAGAGPLTYLAYGTREPADLAFYPRSQKINLHGVCFRIEPVDYWDGEA